MIAFSFTQMDGARPPAPARSRPRSTPGRTFRGRATRAPRPIPDPPAPARCPARDRRRLPVARGAREQNELQIVRQAPLVAECRPVEAGGVERDRVRSVTQQEAAKTSLERGADHGDGVGALAELLDEVAVLERAGRAPTG